MQNALDSLNTPPPNIVAPLEVEIEDEDEDDDEDEEEVEQVEQLEDVLNRDIIIDSLNSSYEDLVVPSVGHISGEQQVPMLRVLPKPNGNRHSRVEDRKQEKKEKEGQDPGSELDGPNDSSGEEDAAGKGFYKYILLVHIHVNFNVSLFIRIVNWKLPTYFLNRRIQFP